LKTVRLTLPEDELVALVKPHTAASRQREQIANLGGLKRCVLFQKIRNAIADFRRVHGVGRILDAGHGLSQAKRTTDVSARRTIAAGATILSLL
jgi:hypothetical protein